MIRLTMLLSVALAPSLVFAAHEFEGRDLALGETLYTDHCAACTGASR